MWDLPISQDAYQPNHEDPLNHEAAAVMRDSPKSFGYNVKKAMAGAYMGSTNQTAKFFNRFKIYIVALNLRTELALSEFCRKCVL